LHVLGDAREFLEGNTDAMCLCLVDQLVAHAMALVTPEVGSSLANFYQASLGALGPPFLECLTVGVVSFPDFLDGFSGKRNLRHSPSRC
jgi:hypothetical protein